MVLSDAGFRVLPRHVQPIHFGGVLAETPVEAAQHIRALHRAILQVRRTLRHNRAELQLTQCRDCPGLQQ